MVLGFAVFRSNRLQHASASIAPFTMSKHAADTTRGECPAGHVCVVSRQGLQNVTYLVV